MQKIATKFFGSETTTPPSEIFQKIIRLGVDRLPYVVNDPMWVSVNLLDFGRSPALLLGDCQAEHTFLDFQNID